MADDILTRLQQAKHRDEVSILQSVLPLSVRCVPAGALFRADASTMAIFLRCGSASCLHGHPLLHTILQALHVPPTLSLPACLCVVCDCRNVAVQSWSAQPSGAQLCTPDMSLTTSGTSAHLSTSPSIWRCSTWMLMRRWHWSSDARQQWDTRVGPLPDDHVAIIAASLGGVHVMHTGPLKHMCSWLLHTPLS
jgi:hypothetical protein